MPEQSTRLKLPLILPSQAQKHVTHNTALEILDALVQVVLLETGRDAPPSAAQEGDCYGLGAAPTGAWAGHAGEIAAFSNGGWLFVMPQEGWMAWSLSEAQAVVFDGADWALLVSADAQVEGVGIRTDWDATNRLAVASPASLFSHDGDDHQLKINKAAVADTASVIFQSNFTGHAEMGLAGDNAFAVKVSADGSTWHEALKADPTAQNVTVNWPVTGLAVQQSPTDTTAGRLMRADYGYGKGNIVGPVSQLAGAPTGAVVERGANANGEYVRFADGTQICSHLFDLTYDTGNRCVYYWTFPAPFATGSNPVGNATIDNEYQGGAAASALAGPWCRGITRTGSFVRLHSPGVFPSTAVYGARAMAFGRWF